MSEKDPGVVRVLIGFPHEGMTGSEAYSNRLQNMAYIGRLQERGLLLKESPRFEFIHKTCGRMHVHIARDEMVKAALVHDCDYVFFIDDDMIAENDLFEKLYANQKDICGPLAFTRNFPHKPVIYSCHEIYDPIQQRKELRNIAVMNYPKDSLREVDAIGFGAALIKIECFKKMPEPWFSNWNKTGEDINFCYEARKHGFSTWVDTRLKLGHVGHPLIVTEDYVQKQWMQMGMDVAKRYGTPAKIELQALSLGD